MPVAPSDPSHYDGHDLEALADLPHYTSWILDGFAPWLQGRVLEVGAGTGNVSARYLDRVSEAVLVEPAANLHHKLAERLGHAPQVETFCGVLADLPPSAEFDAAIMVNVLEHIADDVDVLRQLKQRVRVGGAVLLFVPALPQLYGTLDAMVHHVRRYTRTSLRDAMTAAGWRVEQLRYMDALGMAPWFLAGRVFKRKSFDQGPAQWYDRLGVPVTRALEAVLPPVVGKSLIAIGIRED
jgi:SAM-dependent methyltransferase